MNTCKVMISAVLIASLSMLAFAQQRQAGNPQGAAKGTPKRTTLPTHPQVHHCKYDNSCVTLVRMSRHNPFF